MNIAILIDAENVLPGHADLIFSHAQKLGVVVSKEIFGASSALSSWVAPVLKYAIHPNLTIKAAKGKNSSDIALVIGAMDLLVRGGIDCAIIASSDSDFSALSVRLRNAGKLFFFRLRQRFTGFRTIYGFKADFIIGNLQQISPVKFRLSRKPFPVFPAPGMASKILYIKMSVFLNDLCMPAGYSFVGDPEVRTISSSDDQTDTGSQFHISVLIG